MSLTSKLLRRNVSIPQMLGFTLANIMGLAIVLTALQFYRDVSASSGDDSFISADYLIISKRVEGFGSLLGGLTGFSQSEIAEIEAARWCDDVGQFTAADFDVFASVSFGGIKMSTAFFFESIPDRFFDINPPGWEFTPGVSTTVPVIISKDYLSLYNFGFAPSRGMPQISEAMVTAVPLRLSVSGGGSQQTFEGHIVGFSSRLNTIAVPQTFMDYANARHGSAAPQQSRPSRLIVKLTDSGNPEAIEFMQSNGYEIAGDRSDLGHTARLLSIVTTVVIAIGLVITLLALFILLLSIHLLLQKNRPKLRALMDLGYYPAEVAAPYLRLVAAANIAALLLAIAAMAAARTLWLPGVRSLGLDGAPIWLTATVGLVIALLTTAVNIASIRRHVTSSFR